MRGNGRRDKVGTRVRQRSPSIDDSEGLDGSGFATSFGAGSSTRVLLPPPRRRDDRLEAALGLAGVDTTGAGAGAGVLLSLCSARRWPSNTVVSQTWSLSVRVAQIFAAV